MLYGGMKLEAKEGIPYQGSGNEIEACFYNRRFPVKSCMGIQYTRIKLKYFQKSKNRGLIARLSKKSPSRFLGEIQKK
jgi:hypothetical protein